MPAITTLTVAGMTERMDDNPAGKSKPVRFMSERMDDDPAGKSKPVRLDLLDVGGDVHYWGSRERVQWTLTFFVGIIFLYSVRTAMSICASAIGKDLGWGKQTSGTALSAFFCGYITTNVLGGYLADRVGGATIIAWTALAWAALTALLPVVANSTALFRSGTVSVLVMRFFTGVSQGVFFPSLTSVLTRHVCVNERGLVYSFAYSGSSIGTILTGFAGSLIIEHYHWPAVFYTCGIGSFLWAVWLHILVRKSRANPAPTASDKWHHPSPGKQKDPVPWLKLASSRSVWALFVVYFCSNMCFYNLLSWTPVYFHDAFPESKGWVFNVVPWLLNFVLANVSGYAANSLLAGGASATFVRKSYATLQMFGTALFALLLNSIETFHQALFLMTIIIGLQAFGNCSIAINSQDLAPQHAGALHGVMNCCGAVSGFVGVYLTGWMLETIGTWSSVWNLQAVVSFVGCVVFLVWGSGERVV